jgi:hypothetical protein
LRSAADETKSIGSYSMILLDGLAPPTPVFQYVFLSLHRLFQRGLWQRISGSLTVPQMAANLKAQTTAQVELYKAILRQKLRCRQP